MTEDEIVGWHHLLNRHEFEQTLGDSGGQGSLAWSPAHGFAKIHDLVKSNGYWRRLLRVHWMVRRSNQSILKEINPEYSLEGLMLKVKLQYFGHHDMKSRLIGKDPDSGKD